MLCILLYTLQTLLFKMYADRYPGNEKYTTFVYVSVCGLVASVISFAVGGFSYEFNLTTFILGSINAGMYFLYYLFIYHASKNGPYSVVMIFSIIGGISLPVISDMITLDKIPSVWKVICLLVIFAAAYLVNKRDGESGGVKNKKVFFLSCFGLLIANGAYGSLLNIQQTYTNPSQNDEMLIYSAFFAALFSLIFVIAKNGRGTLGAFKQTKSSLAFMISAASVAATAVNILLIITKYIDITLLWTFCNSGVVVLSLIASAIFFKEKLSKLNLVGCTVIVATLILISYT